MDKNPTQSTLKKFIRIGDSVIIGVSGGPDSMYLLTQCLTLKKAHPFKIIIAHVNHKLRGKQSDRDADFVKNFATKHKLIVETKNLRTTPQSNLEEICRTKRYIFFEKLRRKYKARWILTAHHYDDNIETVLFNLARGSFLSGLKGMEMASTKRHLLRPLLHTAKPEILNFLKKKQIRYRVDRTNKNLQFSRNLLRHKVIPLFQKINPNFTNTFGHNLSNLRQAAEFMDTFAQQWLDQHLKKNNIPLKPFLQQQAIIQKTILASLYKKMYGNSNKFNRKHLEQLLQMLHLQKSNRKKEFGNEYFIGVKKQNNSRIIYIARK